MAAFSSFPLDSSSLLQLPTSSPINKISALFDHTNPNSVPHPHPQNPNPFNHSSPNSDSVAAAANNNSCTAMDSTSEVTDKTAAAAADVGKKRKCRSLKGSCHNSAQSKDKRKQKKSKEEKKEPPTDYIHVRARRGQATDSHSLAERVRREKISERMKLLQALVPGCDKVTGKALMLDEIINYVQSLQNQVEFLSMKLASVNPMFYDFGTDVETFMVRPDQDVNNLASLLQECNNLPHLNNYHLLENPTIFPQAQNPDVLVQGSRQGLWEMDEQRQKMINQPAGFSSNSFLSFH